MPSAGIVGVARRAGGDLYSLRLGIVVVPGAGAEASIVISIYYWGRIPRPLFLTINLWDLILGAVPPSPPVMLAAGYPAGL